MPLSDFFYYSETSPTGLRRAKDWVSGKGGCTVRARTGDVTGSRSASKPVYYDVYADGRSWRAHVVVWMLHHGEVPEGYCVDHENGDALDNRLSNLRLVTHAVNSRNQGAHANNSSGKSGVHLREQWVSGRLYARWIAQWHDLSGRRQSKSFSIDKLGLDAAFVLACECREKAIEDLNKLGAGYTDRHGT